MKCQLGWVVLRVVGGCQFYIMQQLAEPEPPYKASSHLIRLTQSAGSYEVQQIIVNGIFFVLFFGVDLYAALKA